MEIIYPLTHFFMTGAPYIGLILVILASFRLWRELRRLTRDVDELRKTLKDIVDSQKSFLNQIRQEAEDVGRLRPRPVQHLEHYETWDPTKIRAMIKQAERRIRILQTWFPEESDLPQWEYSAQHKPEVQILLASHRNPAILERVRFRNDFRGVKSDEQAANLIAARVNMCTSELLSTFRKCNIEGSIKVYAKGMPFGPIYAIDDVILFGLYPPDRSSSAAPMFRVPTTCETGKQMIAALDAFANSPDTVEYRMDG